MKCCMPFCDISSEFLLSNSELKLKAITFHRFPRAPQIKESWLANLCIEECELPEDAVICSQHFKKDDFYCIKSGLRKLRIGAVPIETPFTQIDVQVCMICLDTGCKLYPLSEYNLETAFTKLTGISMIYRLDKAPKLCAECNQRLMNYAKFRDKSLRAYKLLLHLVKKYGHLTIQNVKEVNRVQNKLTSDLVKHVSEPNYFGPHVINNLKDKIKQENSSDVKNSDENLREEEVEENDARSENSIDLKDTAFTCGYSDDIKNEETYGIEYLSEHDDDNDIESKYIIKNYESIAIDANNTNLYYEMSNDLQTNNDLLIARYEVNLNGEITNDFRTDCDDDNDMSIEKNEVNPNYEISDDLKTNNDEFNDNNDDYYKVEYLNNCFEGLEYDLYSLRTEIKLDVDEKRRIGTNKKIGNNEKVGINKKIGNNKEIENKKQIANDTESNGTNYDQGAKPVRKRHKRASDEHVKPRELVHLKLLKESTMSREDALAELLSRKEKASYTDSTYKCDICYRGFNNEQSYHSHKDKHTEKAGPLECDMCKIHVTTTRQLNSHMRSYHMFKYSCTLCPFVHTEKSAAVLHERWHEGARYTCEHCRAEFSKYTTYLNHLRLKHPADVICSHCGFAFSCERGLTLHMQMTHPFLDPAQKLEGPLCEQCDVCFASETAYKQHLKVAPKHATPGLSFSNDAALRKPAAVQYRKTLMKKRYEKNKNLVCEQCGEYFMSYHSYSGHVRRQRCKPAARRRGRPPAENKEGRRAVTDLPLRFMCEVCGKLFTCQAKLNYHMPLHSGQKQFACDVCGKRFMFRHNVMKHTEIHKEGKRYDCELCGKQFTSKAGRWRHVRVVHYSVTYTCELCDKTFTSVDARNNHIEHVHRGVPWPKRIRGAKPSETSRGEDTDSDSQPLIRARRGDTDSDSRPRARAKRGNRQ